MNDDQIVVARACLEMAKNDERPFPQIVAQLIEAGFERYAVDFCGGTQSWYLPDGECLTLETGLARDPVGFVFDRPAIRAQIDAAQRQAAGYTYRGFCKAAMQAGCVGYAVSFPGRRAVYYGRTAEAHVEHFPD